MRPKLLIAGTLAAAALAGCASRPAPVVVTTSAPVAAAPAAGTTVARAGNVVAVESGARTLTTAPSSGGAGGTTVASTRGTDRITVRFADGTESAYEVVQPATPFRVGEGVNVISRGSDIIFTR